MSRQDIRFWVIGGKYTSTLFDEVQTGSHEVFGPFNQYSLAHAKWHERTQETRWDACSRYTITTENTESL